MIVERDLDVLCLTETWLREEGDDVSIGEMTPPGFSFLHRPLCREEVVVLLSSSDNISMYDYASIVLLARLRILKCA